MKGTRFASKLTAIVFVGVQTCWAGQPTSFSRKDERAIRDVTQAYREAWLKGDTEAVMATLTADAVLLPSGQAPIMGQDAIRAFWWPPNSHPTKVLAMELQLAEIGGHGNLAFARGVGSLTFSYKEDGIEKTTSAMSSFLNILKKGADRRWRMSHRMWSNISSR